MRFGLGIFLRVWDHAFVPSSGSNFSFPVDFQQATVQVYTIISIKLGQQQVII
mgnify:CR=1 FL=1|jgi:hypothetical protein